MSLKKRISSFVENVMQLLFLKTVGYWGAAFILDEDGNIMDDDMFLLEDTDALPEDAPSSATHP